MMSILDRHILRTFAKVLVVSFLCLTGLFIIIDLFGNLEEFISYAERQGSLFGVLADYYGPRVPWFFDRTSGLLALIAAIFTITWLHRTNELTALMAIGVPKARIVRPLVGATLLVALLAVANREVVLPRARQELSRNAQDWLGEKANKLNPRYDYQTGILMGGQATIAADQQITHPSFRLPRAFAQYGRQLAAGQAFYRTPKDGRPGGYLLMGVVQPPDLAKLPSASFDGRPVILSPRDTSWLKPDQCFVVSDVTFEHLAADRAWRQYSSTAELVRALRNPSLDYGQDTRVTVHARLVQPVLDVTLLFLGLPLVLGRANRNLFVAGARCLLLVAGFFVVVLACQMMGNSGFLVSPALAAWLPVLIFAPLAYVAAQRRWE